MKPHPPISNNTLYPFKKSNQSLLRSPPCTLTSPATPSSASTTAKTRRLSNSSRRPDCQATSRRRGIPCIQGVVANSRRLMRMLTKQCRKVLKMDSNLRERLVSQTLHRNHKEQANNRGTLSTQAVSHLINDSFCMDACIEK